MNKRIGKVTLNYDFYDSSDCYSDGDEIEEKMLELSKSGEWEKALYGTREWPILYHFSDIRGNLIEWYPFEKDASVLEIGSGCGAISGLLCRKVKRVVGVELSERRSLINAYHNKECKNLEIVVGNFKNIELTEKFDYITLIGVYEYAAAYMGTDTPYEDMLNKIKKYLKPDGKIFIAIENKMGLKYLNGAKEDHTGKRFAGVENYRYVSGIRTFSKPELIALLRRCGIEEYGFYYPTPDYKLPDTVYSDSFLPLKGDVRTWGTNYDSSRIAFYNEAIAFDQVCGDGMYDYFSNSFLVICGEKNSKVLYAHYSNDRKKEYQTKTIIEKAMGDEKCTARKAYLNNRDGDIYNIFETMEKYCNDLQLEFKNVHYVKPDKVNLCELEYAYIDGVPLDCLIGELTNKPDCMADELKRIIDTCFEHDSSWETDFEVTQEYLRIFGDNVVKMPTKSFRITNADMLLQNMILKDKEIYCIDYEWIFTFPIPIEFVKYRCVCAFYHKFNMYFSRNIDRQQLFVRAGISEQNIPVYEAMHKSFLETVYGKNDYCRYLWNYRKPAGMIKIEGL